MSTAPSFKLLATISIAESKSNPRAHFDPVKLKELADSIKLNGVLEPILVREKGDSFELVCGHRRLRAAKLAGAKMIPAMLHELTDTQVLETQLEENKKRDDLHPLEEAAGYHALLAKKHGYTVAKLAERTTMSVKYIYDRLKLLELTKEAQELFLADRISAGHAILLARLSPKDQARAMDPAGVEGWKSKSGLWEVERSLFDHDDLDDRKRGKYDDLKTVSVRELEAWIAENVRFDRKNVDRVLFPETADAIESAQSKSIKIVPITHSHHLPPEMKGDERTLCTTSWKRADGLMKSKPCEYAVLGVIVEGYGHGTAYDVCIAKEKCKTHWGKEIAARERAAKQRESGGGTTKTSKPAGKPSWQIEEEKRKAKAAAWEKVAPAVLDAFATAVKKAPTKATGLLAKIILDKLYLSRRAKNADDLIPLGETADDLVRHIALQILTDTVCDPWNGDRDTPKLGKAFNVDVAAIVKANTPKQPKPETAKKPKRKAS